MASVFLKLLNLSISASWLVLAVLVLRLGSKRSPKWMNVLLWGIVALRLVLPFSIESALSLIPSAETVSPAVVQFAPAPTITSGVSVIDNAVNPSLSEHFSAVPTASVNPLYVWTEIAGWVWLIGLGAMLLYALVSYLRLRRRVSVSLPIQDHIHLCDAISSPFILGVVKPRIYLPSGLDEVQRQNVLAHERAHLARRDHWWNPLGFALLAAYWFNPMLWLAYVLLCRDIELACDERVIRTMDESAVKTYSTVLLACSMPRKAAITCPLAFGEVGVKERVRNALHYKKPAFWVVAASVAVCVVVAVCFLTNPPRALSKVCGDFWDTEAGCTYTEEQPGADARYTTTNGTVRLSEHLALVRIGAVRPEKKSAVNPKWSTLYLALPGADGAPAERLTIDFIREYDAPGGTKATYTLNIGTRDDSKSYKVLSGQDEIEAFLAYLRGDTALTASSVSIQKISETAYRNALAEEKTSTAWDGRNSSPVCPERGPADYYQVSVRDAGYNNELPINANIYFAVIPGEGLAEESHFTLMEMPVSPRYHNVIISATNAVSADVFLKLEISVVTYYDGDGQPVRSEDFTYALSCFCDLEALEIQQLRVTGEGFRPEKGSSMADTLIGSYADDMGSSLTIRKNADGSYVVDLGIYKFTSVGNTVGSYDPQMNILHISGAADIGGTLAADITADGTGRLIVTLTESPVSTSYLAAGAVFTFWPRVTGYPQYDVVLANICDLRLAGTHGTETDFSPDLLTANDYYQTPGWLLRDLDGDGIPELLLGANWDEGHAVIFNIYRYGGTRAVCVVNGWNRNRWYLCTDGSLANEGSSSAFESSYSYYRYTSGELQHLETLLYLDDGSGGSPWRYSVTTDQYVNSGDFHSVTEAEATAVMDKYTHETLAFTPFVV